MAPSSALLFPTAPRTSACQSLQRVSQQGKCRLSAHWWRVLSEVRSDNNTESIYASAWIDLKNGPVVIESPPNTLGIVDDFWFRYVADLGNAGPAKGKGGKYLFLPPGDTPAPYRKVTTSTNRGPSATGSLPVASKRTVIRSRGLRA